jgi:hypothetical protein
MRIRSHGDEPDDYTHPAAESIDEALARLARQDKHLNPADQSAAQVRSVGPSRASRDRVWTVIRWIIILAVAWVVWRLFQSSGDVGP